MPEGGLQSNTDHELVTSTARELSWKAEGVVKERVA